MTLKSSGNAPPLRSLELPVFASLSLGLTEDTESSGCTIIMKTCRFLALSMRFLPHPWWFWMNRGSGTHGNVKMCLGGNLTAISLRRQYRARTPCHKKTQEASWCWPPWYSGTYLGYHSDTWWYSGTWVLYYVSSVMRSSWHFNTSGFMVRFPRTPQNENK